MLEHSCSSIDLCASDREISISITLSWGNVTSRGRLARLLAAGTRRVRNPQGNGTGKRDHRVATRRTTRLSARNFFPIRDNGYETERRRKGGQRNVSSTWLSLLQSILVYKGAAVILTRESRRRAARRLLPRRHPIPVPFPKRDPSTLRAGGRAFTRFFSVLSSLLSRGADGPAASGHDRRRCCAEGDAAANKFTRDALCVACRSHLGNPVEALDDFTNRGKCSRPNVSLPFPLLRLSPLLCARARSSRFVDREITLAILRHLHCFLSQSTRTWKEKNALSCRRPDSRVPLSRVDFYQRKKEREKGRKRARETVIRTERRCDVLQVAKVIRDKNRHGACRRAIC